MKRRVCRYGTLEGREPSEGLVVHFNPQTSEPWIGIFQFGAVLNDNHAQLSAVMTHPDGRTVVVIARGYAYQVDPESRMLLTHFGVAIWAASCGPSRNILILADADRYYTLDTSGARWEHEYPSWDVRREAGASRTSPS